VRARRAGLTVGVLLPLLAPAPVLAGSGDIVVGREPGLSVAERADVRADAGVRLVRALRVPRAELVRPADGDRAAALAALRADPDVAWAEPDQPRRLAADPLFPLQWGMENAGAVAFGQLAVADADVDAPAAWGITRGAGVTVAVVDTGVDAGHPDLAARVVAGRDFVDDDAVPDDGNGHGTHVAGIVAASLDGGGVTGVAPEARIMPLRVLDAQGNGWASDVASAFEHAADVGVPIVNASLGSSTISTAERLAIAGHPDTLFVVAAGNGGVSDQAPREYPCALTEANVLCVGASDARDARASFSNFGRVDIDVSAPGVRILSSFARAIPAEYAAGFELLDGTSMAAPHAAGVAALVAAVRRHARSAALKAAVLDGADRPAALAGASVTGGRVDAAGALAVAVPAATPQPAPAPVAAAPPPPAPIPPPAPPAATSPAGAAAARVAGVRLSRAVVRCGHPCRPARLRFRLAAPAAVTAVVERRRCAGGRCRWRRAGARTADLAAGEHVWRIGARVAGVRLAPGRWRLTLRTAAGTARVAFRVAR
jgi:subtilisin family serine protease